MPDLMSKAKIELRNAQADYDAASTEFTSAYLGWLAADVAMTAICGATLGATCAISLGTAMYLFGDVLKKWDKKRAKQAKLRRAKKDYEACRRSLGETMFISKKYVPSSPN